MVKRHTICIYNEEGSMKKIEAIVKPHRLEEIKAGLVDAGILHGMTVTEVRGFGRQRGFVEIYRGKEYEVRFLPKIKIELVVKDEDEDQAIAVILDKAKTGEIGDGKIFVYPIEKAIRISSGQKDNDAIQ